MDTTFGKLITKNAQTNNGTPDSKPFPVNGDITNRQALEKKKPKPKPNSPKKRK